MFRGYTIPGAVKVVEVSVVVICPIDRLAQML
jgi:hypothetical protein